MPPGRRGRPRLGGGGRGGPAQRGADDDDEGGGQVPLLHAPGDAAERGHESRARQEEVPQANGDLSYLIIS